MRVKYRESAVCYAETAEPIEMQFGMLSRVGPGNMYYTGMYMPPRKWALLEVSG